MANNHDGDRARTVVVREELAAEYRPLLEKPEGIGRDIRSDESFRRDTLVADVHRRFSHGAKSLEGLNRRPPVLEIGIRDARIQRTAVADAGPDRHDSIRLVEWQIPQEDRVDDREHRVVGSDANRQRDDGGQRDPAVLRQHPGTETQVPHQGVDAWQPSLIAECVHRLGDAAGPNPSHAHGIFPRMTSPLRVFGGQFQMRPELLFQLAVAAAWIERSETHDEPIREASASRCPCRVTLRRATASA